MKDYKETSIKRPGWTNEDPSGMSGWMMASQSIKPEPEVNHNPPKDPYWLKREPSKSFHSHSNGADWNLMGRQAKGGDWMNGRASNEGTGAGAGAGLDWIKREPTPDKDEDDHKMDTTQLEPVIKNIKVIIFLSELVLSYFLIQALIKCL